MTQKKLNYPIVGDDNSEGGRHSRINNAPPDLFDPDEPRIGRRESEPHSAEVTYIYNVLTHNFPESRTIWDLHHHFFGKKGPLKNTKIDIQFDVSFFKDFEIPYSLSSYKAEKYDNRIPDMTINILSKSTWRSDLSEKVDICKNLEIPIYVIYSPFKMTSKLYHPPFIRVYILKSDGEYTQEELYDITLKEGGTINQENLIDTSDILPFRIGLMKLKQEHEGKRGLYRLIFLQPSEPKLFITKAEQVEKDLKKYKEKFGTLE